jgi:hypothetical protein
MRVTARARHPAPLREWVTIVGGALLGQGALSLAVDFSGVTLQPLFRAFIGDPLHALIHVAWGSVMLGLLVARNDRLTLARASLGFGVFYVALAVVGVLVHHPFGLLLGPGENAFHFLVGPGALIMGVWGLAGAHGEDPTRAATATGQPPDRGR